MEPFAHVGPLGIRRFELAKVCDTHLGHQHNYDHTTIVISGRLRAFLGDSEQDYGPGDCFPVLAATFHTLKALEPNTRYLCVFSHRDFSGIITQEYTGNPDAYAERDVDLMAASPRRLVMAG